MNIFRNLTAFGGLITGIAIFVLGILLLFNPYMAWSILIIVIAALIALSGLIYILSVFSKGIDDRLKRLVLGIFFIVGGVALLAFPHFLPDTFNLITGLFGIIIGVLVLINAVKLRHDGAPWFSVLLRALSYVVLGVIMLFSQDNERLFSVLFGIYLIVFSTDIIGDGFLMLLDANDTVRNATRRHVRIALPVIFTAFLPNKSFKRFNELVTEEPDTVLLLSEEKPQCKPDMEVYIHTREGLVPGTGHVDLAIGDVVYSYGNYDSATWILGGFMAEGVLVKMGRQEHIDQSLEDEKKILWVYGLSLTPETMAAVQARIDDIESALVPWYCDAKRCEMGELPGSPTDYDDVSSHLYNNTGGESFKTASGKVIHYDMDHKIPTEFFKFKQGDPFKTYYALGTNCVKLADTVVGNSGIDLLKVNGIITPGAYLNYLDTLYERGHSIVIERTLYQNKVQK